MRWKVIWETIRIIPSVFLGLLMLAAIPVSIIILSYPSKVFSKFLRKVGTIWPILKISCVLIVSFFNFLAISLAYEIFIVAPIDTGYGRGIMNLLLLILGFPTMVSLLIRNLWLVSNKNYLEAIINKLLPD